LFCDYLRPALWLDMLTCGSAWWTVSTNQHIGLRRVALCVCSDFAGARFVCHVPPAWHRRRGPPAPLSPACSSC